MEVVWLDISWKSLNSRVDNKEHIEGEVKEVKVIKHLEYRDNYYIGKEYTNINGKYVNIGIITNKDLVSVSAVGKFGYNRSLIEAQKGIWVSTPQYIWSEELKKYQPISYPIGINQCGVIKFKGEDSKGNKYETPEIKIIPDLVTEEEYDIMETQLKIITENLLDNYQKDYNGSTSGNVLINLDSLSIYIDNLCDILEEINDNPQELLIEVRERVKVDKIKKFNAKLYIEQEMYPYKEMFNTDVSKKTIDLKEHRILKGALQELIDICENQIKYEESINESLRFQINEIKKLKTRDANIAKKANNRIKNIKEKGININNRINTWKQLIQKLNNIIEIEIFKDIVTQSWEDTHIFNFNPLYQEVFDVFETLNKLVRKNEILSIFKHDLIKSPDLYEKWILFKVLDYFINELKFNEGADNLVEKMIEYYNEYSTLRGFSIEIRRKEGQSIIITSEKNLEGQRPDLSLVMIDKYKCREVFLDAKYKPYSKRLETLQNDLKISAYRYLQLSKNSIGAFLIHPDKNLTSNFEYLKPHRCGYITSSPKNSYGISIFAKMLIHFYMGWDYICPECGNIGNILEDKGYKTHYECSDNKCGAFWVRNSCRYKKEHPNNVKNLYKYIDGNYHRESKLEWDVHCPVCSKSYRGDLY